MMIRSYVLLGTLGVHSIEDLKDKKITVTITLLSGIAGIWLHLFYPRQSIFDMLAGMIPGMLILLFSRLGQGKIGMGDGMVFMLTGLYLGAAENLFLMFLSFALAGFCGLLLLILGVLKREDRIPLVPFLFLGYLMMVVG